MWIKDGPYKTNNFYQEQPTSEVTTFNSTSCSYQRRVVLTMDIIEMMNEIVELRCRTDTRAENLTSDVLNVFVDPQGIK